MKNFEGIWNGFPDAGSSPESFGERLTFNTSAEECATFLFKESSTTVYTTAALGKST